MDFDWKSLVKTVAPWIGTAIGGPLGGAAVTALGSALGLSDATEATVKQALQGVTPEQMAAMKAADQDFAIKMQAAGFADTEALEAIAAGDRKDARALEATTRSRMPAILTLVLCSGYLLILIGQLYGVLDKGDSQMLGTLQAMAFACVTFWVGTTHDSGRKTDALMRGQANG